MNQPFNETWTVMNQRYLNAALTGLRERITNQPGNQESLHVLAADMPVPPAIETLRQTFGLSPFESDLVLLCAGIELDAHFATAVTQAAGATAWTAATFSLAMALLNDAHWSALAPVGPLRHWRLIEIPAGDMLTRSPLRINERILHYLTGVQYLDDGLAGIVAFPHPAGALAPSHQHVAEQIANAWTAETNWSIPPLVQIQAAEGTSATAIACEAVAQLGLRLAVLRAQDVPANAHERVELIRLWEREAALGSLALLVDCQTIEANADEHPGAHFLSRVASPVMALTRHYLTTPGRPSIQITISAPDRNERQGLWEAALGNQDLSVNGGLARISEQFAVDASAIDAISAELRLLSNGSVNGSTPNLLWDLCRQRTRPRMDGLAQHIEPAAGWEDLVIPVTQAQILQDIAVHVRQRGRVYGEWGFASRGRRGLGISALFAGPSGTGKTMAAEVLARELRLDLYRIDLSQVVSKYIGETEKNLGKLFDVAEGGGVILLFDEADALFGKRSEVRDSHDRYANIEVSYLLQRMESYDGLAILTTNLKGALDQAFMRRIRFVVQFPFPDADARAAIWKGIFPQATPVNGLDMTRLARLNVAGGNIRNIALNAAFLAADAGQPVGMQHLLQAARSESSKLERPLSEAETRGWVQVISEGTSA